MVRRALRRLALPRLAADVLATSAGFAAASGRHPVIAGGAMLAALSIVVGRGVIISRRAGSTGAGATGSSVLARTLVVLAITAALAARQEGWVAGALLALVALAEVPMVPLVRLAVPVAQNLPGVTLRSRPFLPPTAVFLAHVGGIVALAVTLRFDPRTPWILVVPLVVWAFWLAVATDAGLRVIRRLKVDRRLPDVIADYSPRFLVHWYAPKGSVHQLTMWLPYLDRLGQPYVIVVRNAGTFAEVVAATQRPVILRRYGPELGAVVAPTVRTVFYVNTSPRNEPMLSYLDLRHIQLNHGDSEKAPSYRRIFRVYDKNFVAGQAAIDRFAKHGVDVDRRSFEIVGRPQVESIAVRPPDSATRRVRTVLYAPTWLGYLDDSRYCSLPFGLAIVEALLDRDCAVIFRPHPWTWRSRELGELADRITARLTQDARASGRVHVVGAEAREHLSLFDCFNRVEALVADISSVVPDFLYSEKPFVLTCTDRELSQTQFVDKFPLAKASYVLTPDPGDWSGVLDALLDTDPKCALRRQLKTYYLGDFPPDRYADGFVRAAAQYV